MKTLLQLIQAVCSELGLTQPTTVASSPDTQYQQLFAFINRLGADLTTDYEWQELDKEYIFTTTSFQTTGTWTAGSAVVTGIPSTASITEDFGAQFTDLPVWTDVLSVDSATQVTLTRPAETSGSGAITFTQMRYDLPSDWSKQVPQTEWDRTNFWPLAGPKTAQEWSFLKGGIVSTGPRLRFRIQGSKFTLNPVPSDGEVLSFEYISNAWVVGSDGTAKSEFTADDDTCIFADSLMILGTKMLWREEKGFESTIIRKQFEDMRSKKTAQNASAPKLSMSMQPGNILLGPWNIQDGNWPG
jgi:hypothetical protein